MDFSLGLIHLSPGPVPLSAEDQALVNTLSDDLLLAVSNPGEHLPWEAFSLVAPLFEGGALTAIHALLLAARHPLLLVLDAPPTADQVEEIRALQWPSQGTGAVLLAASAGEPPRPMLLHRCALRPLERLLRREPDAKSLPAGLGVKRR